MFLLHQLMILKCLYNMNIDKKKLQNCKMDIQIQSKLNRIKLD